MHPDTQVFGHMGAAATGLGSAFGRDFHEYFAVFLTLVLQVADKLSPPGIGDAFTQMMVSNHVFNGQILYCNHVILFNYAAGNLVQKVFALVGYFSVYPGYLFR